MFCSTILFFIVFDLLFWRVVETCAFTIFFTFIASKLFSWLNSKTQYGFCYIFSFFIYYRFKSDANVDLKIRQYIHLYICQRFHIIVTFRFSDMRFFNKWNFCVQTYKNNIFYCMLLDKKNTNFTGN